MIEIRNLEQVREEKVTHSPCFEITTTYLGGELWCKF